MRSSAGVVANAIIALIGSTLTLGMGLLALFSIVVTLTSGQIDTPKEFPYPAAYLKAFMLLIPLVYLLPAIWGICTGIGLLRLKNWARISIIVFGGILTAFGLVAVLVVLAMFVTPFPPSPGMDPSFLPVFRAFMAIIALAELGLGVWWLVFFNRARVKIQFQRMPMLAYGMPQPGATAPPPNPAMVQVPLPRPVTPPSPSRPISVTVIACLLFLGCIFLPLNIGFRMPALFFTVLLTGWPAIAYYTVLMAVSLYVGIGLLRLWPAARLVGLGYLVVSALNSAVFSFAPGSRARLMQLMEAQSSIFPWMKAWQTENTLKFDLTGPMMVGTVFGLIMFTVAFYFLFTSKHAFDAPNRQVAS